LVSGGEGTWLLCMTPKFEFEEGCKFIFLPDAFSSLIGVYLGFGACM